jgi:tRNA (guanine37-N1)-methyltransferase
MPKEPSVLNIQVITLFPDIFASHLTHLPMSRAVEKGLLQLNFINLRDFAIDKRGTVDSSPYGGGPGMILRPEPIFNAINFALRCDETSRHDDVDIVFLTPRGKTYNQACALSLSTAKNVILVCGRYEGMDQRVIDYFVNDIGTTANIKAQEVSLGNFVLSGGEVAAMSIIESVTRLIPGAIDNQEALTEESFNQDQPNRKEHPQYSRPEEWEGMKVPAELLSGHHENIKKWKLAKSLAK